MRGVKAAAPRIIEDLATNVKSLYLPIDKGLPHTRKSPDFIAWLKRSKLRPPNAVFDWAMRTFDEWDEYPQRKADLDWTATVYASYGQQLHYNGFVTRERLRELPADQPLEAFPELEGPHEFMARAQRHWNARVAARPDQTPLADSEPIYYFDWLAMHLVSGMNFSQIQKAVRHSHRGLQQSTVARGVKAAAQTLGITLRHAPPGRPRKRTTR